MRLLVLLKTKFKKKKSAQLNLLKEIATNVINRRNRNDASLRADSKLSKKKLP